MLTLGQQLVGKKVLSLRTSGQLGEVIEPIINPTNLKIEGWFVNDRFNHRRSVLLSKDVRDLLPQGFVVNDHEALTDPDDLIRHENLIKNSFELIGKHVVTTGRSRLGKVHDYAFNKNEAFIQKLYVSPSLLKSLGGGNTIVDRSQIVEINNKNIVIKEATVPIVEEVGTPAIAAAEA